MCHVAYSLKLCLKTTFGSKPSEFKHLAGAILKQTKASRVIIDRLI